MLHFAFIDGAIGYDCVACGARCCHGLGFALARDELVPLLGRVPGFGLFLQPQADAVYAFDLDDGCWALAGDGRCGIEVAHGHAAKPSTCRLFPANRLLRSDGVTVVDLQWLHCPLGEAHAIDATRAGACVLRHADVAAAIDAAGAGALGSTARLAPGAPADLWTCEAAVREAAGAALAAPDAAAVLAATGGDGDGLRARARRWRDWLELPRAAHAAAEAALVRPFALVLSSLRLRALTQPGAPPYPRLLRGLDARLAAGAFLAACSALAGRAPSLRAVVELWHKAPLVRELLARWDEPVTLADAAPPASAPAELVAAWTALLGRAATRPIGDALAGTPLDARLRPLLLRLASDRMR